MTPFFKNPFRLGGSKSYNTCITSVTCDSVEKITAPFLNYIRYQNDLICPTDRSLLCWTSAPVLWVLMSKEASSKLLKMLVSVC